MYRNVVQLKPCLEEWPERNWLCYSRIHINRDEWFSLISQSILNQLSWYIFRNGILEWCGDYPENIMDR